MTENMEIFENEEATKFLDYFVAYKKLMTTMDNIKALAAQKTETNFPKEELTEPNIAYDLNDSPSSITFQLTLDK
jgi:hypothetical protein